MKLSLLFALSFSALLMSNSAYGQGADWVAYEDSRRNIYFEVPGNVLIDRNGDKTTLTSYAEGATFSVMTDKLEKNPRKVVKGYDLDRPKGTKEETYTSKDFLIRRLNKPSTRGQRINIYAGSDTAYFQIAATGPVDSPAIARFLNTLRFAGTPLLPHDASSSHTTAANPIVFDEMPISPIIQAALDHKVKGTQVPTFASIKDELPTDRSNLSRDLQVLRKPTPGYTDAARARGWEGDVLVNVEFLKSGDLGRITIDKKVPRDIGRNIVVAISQLKFIPAESAGKPIDTERTIIYSFRLY